MHLTSVAACFSGPVVYPIGYSTRYAMQRIDDLMNLPMTLLIDTRYKPTSRIPQWRRSTLERVYGERYCWMGEYLGNVNYNNGQAIELANPEPGILRLCEYLQSGYRIILLCQCSNYKLCHRAVIVQLLLQAWSSVQVVQPEILPAVEGYHCLSIRPPYSHWLANPRLFIKHGVLPKTIENRGWRTNYRGELLLHASTTFEQDALDYWTRRIPGLATIVPTEKKDYPQGAIVGIARLVDVIDRSDDIWFCGDYGFVLEGARPIGPIPYPGALKIFEVPRSVVDIHLPVPSSSYMCQMA